MCVCGGRGCEMGGNVKDKDLAGVNLIDLMGCFYTCETVKLLIRF